MWHKYAPDLSNSDIYIPASSVPGSDLHLSEAAREIYPFYLEAKNVEKLNIWAAIKQVEIGSEGSGLIPLVVFSRNNESTYAVCNLEHFTKLIR